MLYGYPSACWFGDGRLVIKPEGAGCGDEFALQSLNVHTIVGQVPWFLLQTS
jgi:hypothetical protein